MASIARSSVARKDRPADLPDFARPPLVEVVLGVQFSELRSYRTYHAGLLWDSKFRSQFPVCVEQLPLDNAFEIFGAPRPAQPGLQIRAAQGPVVPRLWFINREENELIQVQANRFLHNWRRAEGNTTYSRYEPIRERFFDELTDVQTFFDEEDIGPIEPNQCEVTYVNHIVLDDQSDPRSHFHRLFAFWRPLGRELDRGGARLPELEDGRCTLSFVIQDPDSGEPRGRLHIDVQPAIQGEDKPIIRVSLTARGSPTAPTFQGAADFLDIGREAIVRGFAAVTAPGMHEHWGRIK